MNYNKPGKPTFLLEFSVDILDDCSKIRLVVCHTLGHLVGLPVHARPGGGGGGGLGLWERVDNHNHLWVPALYICQGVVGDDLLAVLFKAGVSVVSLTCSDRPEDRKHPYSTHHVNNDMLTTLAFGMSVRMRQTCSVTSSAQTALSLQPLMSCSVLLGSSACLVCSRLAGCCSLLPMGMALLLLYH